MTNVPGLSTSTRPRELRSQEIGVHAYRGGGGEIEFTLPCGEKRRMTRYEANILVTRITEAVGWLSPVNAETKTF